MHEMKTVVRLETHIGDEQIGGMCEQLRVRALEGLADANGPDRFQRSFDIAERSRIGLDEQDVLSRRRNHRRHLTHPAPRCLTKPQWTVGEWATIQYFGADELWL
jgi:hypothetical protein